MRALIDPFLGLYPWQARQIAFGLGIPAEKVAGFAAIARQLYDTYVSEDATLTEINPLVLTGNDEWLALDAKMSIDDNALFRHPEFETLRDLDALAVAGPPFDMSHLKDRDRGMIHLLLDKVEASGRRELIPLLEERGVHLSASQVYRLVAERPERLNLHVLMALTDILGCSADDLVVKVDLGQAQKDKAVGEQGKADPASAVIRSRALRPRPARITE